ncbi:MAG: hypothetical protein N3A63_04830 [Bacteroidetes bacterium]|nr:hypothetical protein [Bacteroidota bacterium]
MDTKTMKSLMLLCLCVGIIVGITIGCDMIIPEEFKEKIYSSPAEEQYICSLFMKPITTTASPRQVSDSTVYLVSGRALSSFAFIPQQELDTMTDNKLLKKYYTQIVDSLPNIPKNSLVFFEYAKRPADAPKTIYAKLVVPTQATYTIYVSLEFYFTSTTSNLGENVLPEVLRSDTSSIPLKDVITNEQLSACSQTVTGAGTTTRVLTIKGRYEATLDQGTYVVRFTLTKPEEMVNPTTRGLFYFKLYIRSK